MSEARTITVGLKFTADTALAKALLESLKKSLSTITSPLTNQSLFGKGLDKDILNSITLITKLKAVLSSSINADTGFLNLNKLNVGLKQTGLSITGLSTNFKKLGPEGEQAFLKLNDSIQNAEIPVLSLSNAMGSLLRTFKNVVLYSASTAIYLAAVGSIEKAYSYAQNLNKSLNDIRIVTGQSAEEMAKFAKEANKAAKALSTTTTDYTNASLIYYQLGLSDSEVKERTDVTVKMANVVGESAETVSSLLTAIWNNFAEAGDNLEYYADVITKLGAATASSSDEISDGLEKFASIAKTTGLEYETATAALATVSSLTRQSADVIGTAFKSIFSRLESLKLGETLEDNVTLTQYTEALKTVGVDVLSANGELKDLTTILNELGSAWGDLDTAQKTALTNTVAGQRQYSTFMSLMENWDKVLENVTIAETSSGTLTEQADIYAESWLAAKGRVTAAAEDIYDSLIDDKFFIKLTDGFGDFLGIVDNLVDSFGGLKGILGTVLTLAVSFGKQQLGATIMSAGYGIKDLISGLSTGKALKEESIEATKKMMEGSSYFNVGLAPLNYAEFFALLSDYSKKAKDLLPILQEALLLLQDSTKELIQLTLELEKLANLYDKAYEEGINNAGLDKKTVLTFIVQRLEHYQEDYKELFEKGSAKRSFLDSSGEEIERELRSVEDLNAAYKEEFDFVLGILNIHNEIANALKQREEAQDALNRLIENENYDNEDNQEAIDNCKKLIAELNDEIEQLYSKKELKVSDLFTLRNESRAKADNSQQLTTDALKAYKEAQDNATASISTWAKSLTNAAQAATSLISAWSMLTSLLDTLKDPDASAWEKMVSIFTSLAMAIPLVVNGLKAFKEAEVLTNTTSMLNAVTTALKVRLKKLETEATKENTLAINLETAAEAKNTVAKAVDNAASGVKGKNKKDPFILYNGKGNELVYYDYNESKKHTITSGKKGNLKPGDTVTSEIAENLGIVGPKAVNLESASGAVGEGSEGALGNGIKVLLTEKLAGLKEGFLGLGGAFKSLSSLLAPFAGLITIVGAAIAATVLTTYLLVEAYNKLDDEARSAAAAAEEAANALATTKSKYDELSSAASEYLSAKESLSTMVEGTTEYKEALLKANEAAMEVIKNSPGIEFENAANGLLILSDAAIETAKATKLAAYNELMAGAYTALILANDAELAAARQLLGRDSSKNWFTSLFSVSTNEEEAIIDAVVEAYKNDSTYLEHLKALDFSDAVDELVDLSNASEGAAESIWKNADALEEYAEEVISLETANNAMYALLTNEKFSLYIPKNEDLSDYNSLAALLVTNSFNMDEYKKEHDLYASWSALEDYYKSDEDEYVSQKMGGTVTKYIKYYDLNGNEIDEDEFDPYREAEDHYLIDGKEADEALEAEIIKYLNEWSKSVGTFAEDLIAEDYLKKVYGDEYKNYKFTSKKGKKWNLEKKNEETGEYEVVQEDITQDSIRETLAEYDFINNLTKKDTEEAAKTIKGIDDVLNTVFSIEEGESITDAGDRLSILTDIANGNRVDLTGMTLKELEALKENQTANYEAAVAAGSNAMKAYAAIYGTEAIDNSKDYTKKDISGVDASGIEEQIDALKQKNLEATTEWVENEGWKTSDTELNTLLEDVEMSSEAFDTYTNSLYSTYKAMGMTEEQARELAVLTLKTSKAVSKLSDIYDDNEEALDDLFDTYKDGQELTATLAQAVAEMSEALTEWLGVDFTSDDVLDNLENVLKAIEGDEEALRDLSYVAAEKIVIDMGLSDETIELQLLDFVDELDEVDQDLEIGATLNLEGQDEFIESLNDLLKTGQITAEQAASYLSAIGVEAQPDHYEDVPAGTTKTTTYSKTGSYDSKTGDFSGETINTRTDSEITNTISVPVYKKGSLTYKNAGTSTKLPSSSGKSTSSGSSKSKKNKNSEVDAYYEINEQLEDMKNNLDEVSTLKDRAFGAERLAYMEQEIGLMEQLNELLDEEAAIAQQQMDLNASYLNGYGAEYDEYGRLTNYNEIMTKAVNDYNSGTIDDDEYTAIKEYIDAYTEALNKSEDIAREKAENIRKILDAKLEKANYAIEVNIKINEADLKRLEFLLEDLEDVAFAQAEENALRTQQLDVNYSNYSNNKQGIYDNLVEYGATKELIDSFMSNGDIGTIAGLGLTNDTIELLEEYVDGMLDAYTTMKEIRQEIEDSVLEAYDEYNEKIEQQLSLYDHYDSVIDSYKTIIDLVGKGNRGISSAVIAQLREALVANAKNQVQSLKEIYENSQKEQAIAEEELQKARERGNDHDILYWEGVVQTMTENTNSAQEEFLSGWTSMALLMQDSFADAVDNIVDDFDAAISGMYGSIENISSLFDSAREVEEQFLDDYNKTYETTKLVRDITKKVDSTDNLKYKKQYAAFLKEITDRLKDGTKLSQEELEIFQKRLAVLEAELALEDAKNNKYLVQLTRDSEGNFGYMYTADLDSILEALLNLDDAQADLYNTINNAINEENSNLFGYVKEREELMSRMSEATTEEEKAAIQELLNQNEEKIKGSRDKLNSFFELSAKARESDLENYDKYITSFSETTAGKLLREYDTIEDYVADVLSSSKTAVDEINEKSKELETGLTAELEKAGLSATDLGDTIHDVVYGNEEAGTKGIIAESDEAKSAISQLGADSVTAFGDAATAATEAEKKFSPVLTKMKDEIDDARSAYAALLKELSKDLPDLEYTITENKVTNVITNYKTTGDTSGGGTDPDTEPVANTSKVTKYLGDTKISGATLNAVKSLARLMFDSKGGDERAYTDKEWDTFLTDKPNKYKYITNDGKLTTQSSYYALAEGGGTKLKISYIKAFDTGGYTGEWGADGRLAMLHEKELVLNASDTANLLSAVEMVRDVVNAIDLYSNSYRTSVSTSASTESIYREVKLARQGIDQVNDTLLQIVNVTAEFPNAADHNEIQRALQNLINTSAQYADRF